MLNAMGQSPLPLNVKLMQGVQCSGEYGTQGFPYCKKEIAVELTLQINRKANTKIMIVKGCLNDIFKMKINFSLESRCKYVIYMNFNFYHLCMIGCQNHLDPTKFHS